MHRKERPGFTSSQLAPSRDHEPFRERRRDAPGIAELEPALLGGFLREIDKRRTEEAERSQEGKDTDDGAETGGSGRLPGRYGGGGVQRTPKRIFAMTHNAITPSCQAIFLPSARLRAL